MFCGKCLGRQLLDVSIKCFVANVCAGFFRFVDCLQAFYDFSLASMVLLQEAKILTTSSGIMNCDRTRVCCELFIFVFLQIARPLI